MIHRVDCGYAEDGKPTLRLFSNSEGLVGIAKTVQAAKYIFDTYGGPASTITGEIPDTHQDFWQKVCDAL